MLALVVLGTAACGRAVSPVSPTTPTASNFGTSPSSGATVTGSVTGAGSGLSVGVVGTTLTAQADGGGRFQLSGVPAGNVSLRVASAGGSATASLGPVADRERVQVTVKVTGNSATVEVNERVEADDGADVEGQIASISTSAQTFQVGTNTVQVMSTTTIRSGGQTLSFGDLTVGERVEVKGVLAGSIVNAQSVEVSNGAPPPPSGPGNTDVKGVVSSLLAGTSCSAQNLSFMLASGTTVTTSATTRFDEGSCAAITAGASVEVKGVLQGSTIAAQSVEVSNEAPAPGSNGTKVMGVVASLVAGTSCSAQNLSFMLADGTTVTTTATTRFDEGSCTTIAVGATVEAKGTLSGATLAAASVQIDAEGADAEASIEGTIAASPAPTACPAPAFTVKGVAVVTTATTRFDHGTCANAIAGVSVEVEGTRSSSGTITATRVRFNSNSD
jgi:hypothetical protein